MISRAVDQSVASVTVKPMSIADHHCIDCVLAMHRPSMPPVNVPVRDFRQLQSEHFADDIAYQCQQLLQRHLENTQEMVKDYDTVLRTVLEKHAPITNRLRRRARPCPWYTNDVKEAREKKRQCEHRWRSTKLEVHRQLYVEARNTSTACIAKAKCKHYQDTLQGADNKSMFRLVRSFGAKQKAIYPEFCSTEDGCSKFAQHFSEKVRMIRAELEVPRSLNPPLVEKTCFTEPLVSFDPTSDVEIEKFVLGLTKTCELDPLPRKQIQQCLSSLVPVIAAITNKSLEEGTMPSALKMACVHPLLKKPSLDRDILRNYRPVSTLSHLSKVIEKVVALRLSDHLDSQNLNEPFQSAYRRLHSTETALLRVCSDIRAALDRKKGTLLVLLDLSSAFDTIDHTILLNRLSKRYGIQGYALRWVASYLQDRKQRVVIGQATSENYTCTTGVPQGSVLGPALFSLYVQPVGDVIRRHGVKFHHYADDLQLMHTFDLNPTSLSEAIRRLQDCIMDIREWLTSNYLKVNDKKTEFLPIVPVSAKKLIKELSISVGGALIQAVDKVKNLGVYLDNHMNMSANTSEIVRCCYFHIHHIGQINKFLPRQTRERVVNALVTSRLDYCNSLLYGTVDKNFARLQRLQNTAARLIMRIPKYSNITPVLKELHWLPVRERVCFKIMLLVHRAVNCRGPVYLRDLICIYTPTRALRSEGTKQLKRPKTNCKAGDASFPAAAPDLWNRLPFSIRELCNENSFKNALKTLYFNQYFG